MIIIGGMGSLLGAVLGTVFVVLFPYAIDGGMARNASPIGFRRWYLRSTTRRSAW